jgi:hypothetical protein
MHARQLPVSLIFKTRFSMLIGNGNSFTGVYQDTFVGMPEDYSVDVETSNDGSGAGAGRRSIHARQSQTTKCPGTNTDYNVTYAVQTWPQTLRGPWFTVYPR